MPAEPSFDGLIAGILNRNGLVTGNGNRWTRERVTSLRSHHRIPVYNPVPGRGDVSRCLARTSSATLDPEFMLRPQNQWLSDPNRAFADRDKYG
jgi:hypothetical protein